MPGRVLGGRYRLTELLGRGGMGEVWAAHDDLMGRSVAVKLLQGHAPTPHDVERFKREAQIARRLSHPNIVTIHDFDEDSGTRYLVTELLDGRNLVVASPGILPSVQEVLGWVEQIAAGLAAAHGVGVFHHDLKPANIQVTDSGLVKILDLGLARYASTPTKASAIVGTLAYMAPERAQGKIGDGRSDLYSLGCMLVELLTGELPFQSLDPPALMMAHITQPPSLADLNRPDVPPALRDLIERMLAKNPDDRPGSAQIVQAELKTCRSY
jgi:serine/threonine-protein kinase